MGSNLFLRHVSESNRHGNLDGRNESYQHELSSIYRSSDGKNLNDIVNELIDNNRCVSIDFKELQEDSNIVTLTKFVYNTVKDVLLVFVDGVLMSEGTDKDYIKDTSSTIKFNFTVPKGHFVTSILAGTISGISYGDEVSSGLSKFTQLTDTFDTFVGKENKVLVVNNAGTGIEAKNISASHDLHELSFEANVKDSYEISITMPNVFYITGIKATKLSGMLNNFEVSIFNTESEYVYDSGIVNGVLWDIMKIPVILHDNVLKLYMKCPGVTCKVKFIIYYEL